MALIGKNRVVGGVVPPLVTPLAGRDGLDEGGLERLVDHVIEGGVDGIFLLGSTGEGPSLSGRLRREVVRVGCRRAAGRRPVLVGISDTAMEESLELARHAADCGAAAVVATTPYYFPPGQDDLVGYFSALAAESPLPLFLYNMPALTGGTVIAPPTVERLMQEPGIIGIKDSSGDFGYFTDLLKLAPRREGWSVFMGREELGTRAGLAGAHGVVPGGANLAPAWHARAWRAVVAGDQAAVADHQAAIDRLGEAVFTLGSGGAGFIQGLKAALSIVGVCSDALAPPFRPLAASDRRELERRLTALGLGAVAS